MPIPLNATVMLPSYTPYPRYGRVASHEDAQRVRVTRVQCGDPRCTAEHKHADEVWTVADLLVAGVYQPRASWEEGRKSSPNAPVEA